MRNWRRYILTGLCAAALAVFLIVPIVLAIGRGFADDGRFSLYWLKYFFRDFAARAELINSVKVAVLTTLLVTAISLPLAVLGRQYEFRGKNLVTALLMVPMILPPFVGALAIKKLLAAEGGAVNLALAGMGLGKVDWLGGGLWGVVILETLHLYPIMYLNASAALANVDPTMLEASRNLGASPWRTFWKITFPLIRPGLFAGGTIVFVWSFTELGTPQMLEYATLPVAILDGFQGPSPGASTYMKVFVMLSASVGLYAVGRALFGSAAARATAGRGVASTTRRAGGLATALIWAAFAGVTLLAVVPHLGVVLLAFSERWSTTILPQSWTLKHFREVFATESTWRSVLNSLRYASAATAVDIVLGLVIAFLVVRLRVRGAGALDSLSMLPLAVPGLVIAGGYVALTAPGLLPGPVGEVLTSLGPMKDPTLILIIAYSVRRLPYMVRSISAGLQQTSETLEEAARNLGAGPVRAALKVTVPLISANVVAGAILTFSFSMLEVSDSLVLAQTPPYYPITKEIFILGGGTLGSNYNLAAAMGTLAMGLLTAALIAANLLLGKRLGAMFRV